MRNRWNRHRSTWWLWSGRWCPRPLWSPCDLALSTPNLELGQGTGSLPATPGKGMVLVPVVTPLCTVGLGISPRAKDPSYAGASGFARQSHQDSIPEGGPPEWISGVNTQESSPCPGLQPGLWM